MIGDKKLSLKDRRRVSLPSTLEVPSQASKLSPPTLLPSCPDDSPLVLSSDLPGAGHPVRWNFASRCVDEEPWNAADCDPASAASSSTRSPPSGGRHTFANRFDIGKTIGSGTTSVVLTCTRRADGKQLAVKVVHSEDEEMRQFTYDEFALLKSLRHPSIMRVEEMFPTPCTIRIVMEYACDGNVGDYVEEHGGFDEPATTHLFKQLMEGVDYLHRKRIAHRDLKPANLVLTLGGQRLKITDFNSAKKLGADSSSGIMLTLRGTHFYNAPEMRFSGCWNERVDIWASGFCLYFMLKARPPFNSERVDVSKILLLGRLPEGVCWAGMSHLMRNLNEQCLTVPMRDRPTAMELLIHPVFFPLSGSSCSDGDGEPAALQSSSVHDRHMIDSLTPRDFRGGFSMRKGPAMAGARTPSNFADAMNKRALDWLPTCGVLRQTAALEQQRKSFVHPFQFASCVAPCSSKYDDGHGARDMGKLFSKATSKRGHRGALSPSSASLPDELGNADFSGPDTNPHSSDSEKNAEVAQWRERRYGLDTLLRRLSRNRVERTMGVRSHASAGLSTTPKLVPEDDDCPLEVQSPDSGRNGAKCVDHVSSDQAANSNLAQPASGSAQSPRQPRRRPRERNPRKFFTTHGGGQEPDDDLRDGHS